MARLMDTPQSRGTFGEMIVASIFDPRFFGEEEHTKNSKKNNP